jgi:proline iminopeptidase
MDPLKALSDERPVIFYDQLGCGRSDRPEDTTLWNVPRFVDELDALCNALELKKVHILGQSWGSMLAVEYMLRKQPSRVKSLILSGPYLSSPLWSKDQRDWIEELPASLKDTILKYEAEKNYGAPAYQEAVTAFYQLHLCRMDPWPEELLLSMEHMGTAVYEYMWGPSEFTLTGTLREADLTSRLSELSVPVLFTCGEFDEARPETVAYFQSLIPGSQMHVFQGASHSHILEQPNEYNAVIKAFLEKLDGK